MSKVVFVGNVPYNMGEEQLIDVFKSVGQVVGFRYLSYPSSLSFVLYAPPRLVFDRETGKPRGYGFCEFADHETALSAVRNLNNVDVGGRPLRIDLADSDPFLEGKTTVRGELIDGGETRAQWRERENAKRERERESVSDGAKDKTSFLRNLPRGVPVPPGTSALDMISQTLATMNPTQLVEVLAQFKAFVITHPDQARYLLVAHPQLAYALFQALLLNKIVDPAILQRMLAATNSNHTVSAPTPTSAPAPAPHLPPPPTNIPPLQQPTVHPPYHGAPAPQQIPQSFYPSQVSMHPSSSAPPPQQQQQPLSYYGVPPLPPQQHQPPPVAPAGAIDGIDPSQKVMLLQVLRLTQEQINQLAPAERDAILALRSQLGNLA
ncbi:hinge domain of cleavage stimulation factor subunit 2-domain-containing protein [Russula compacta]|nr:hinge domain of cleavage stimulation factor subunit 2-domain-containing protein [Russula compacta]